MKFDETMFIIICEFSFSTQNLVNSFFDIAYFNWMY